MELYPKALVLTNAHPFGGTEMMARSLAAALTANGYDAEVLNCNSDAGDRAVRLLTDPALALIITTGTLPLQLHLHQTPLWMAVPRSVTFITYIIDAWPYDYVRVEACRDYFADREVMPNLYVASVERNDARLIGSGTHYFPSGAYPAPRRSSPKQHPDRLIIWASANKELAVTALYDDFRETLRANNPWGLDDRRIASASDALRGTSITHGLSAIADALGMPVDEVVTPFALTALCALDSCLKRYRRVKVVKALRGFPVDIYGENWAQHVADVASFRLLKPSPDHNHAFGHLCQHYAGLFNFDPNFGHGTNERAVSALALGIPIANNLNARTDNLKGCIPYRFDDDAIRESAERLLAFRDEVPLVAEHTWEYLVGGLLRDVALH